VGGRAERVSNLENTVAMLKETNRNKVPELQLKKRLASLERAAGRCKATVEDVEYPCTKSQKPGPLHVDATRSNLSYATRKWLDWTFHWQRALTADT
jgi:hypothetical protein